MSAKWENTQGGGRLSFRDIDINVERTPDGQLVTVLKGGRMQGAVAVSDPIESIRSRFGDTAAMVASNPDLNARVQQVFARVVQAASAEKSEHVEEEGESRTRVRKDWSVEVSGCDEVHYLDKEIVSRDGKSAIFVKSKEYENVCIGDYVDVGDGRLWAVVDIEDRGEDGHLFVDVAVGTAEEEPMYETVGCGAFREAGRLFDTFDVNGVRYEWREPFVDEHDHYNGAKAVIVADANGGDTRAVITRQTEARTPSWDLWLLDADNRAHFLASRIMLAEEMRKTDPRDAPVGWAAKYLQGRDDKRIRDEKYEEHDLSGIPLPSEHGAGCMCEQCTRTDRALSDELLNTPAIAAKALVCSEDEVFVVREPIGTGPLAKVNVYVFAQSDESADCGMQAAGQVHHISKVPHPMFNMQGGYLWSRGAEAKLVGWMERIKLEIYSSRRPIEETKAATSRPAATDEEVGLSGWKDD